MRTETGWRWHNTGEGGVKSTTQGRAGLKAQQNHMAQEKKGGQYPKCPAGRAIPKVSSRAAKRHIPDGGLTALKPNLWLSVYGDRERLFGLYPGTQLGTDPE